MSDRAPYSRVYWSIVDDPKFVDVYDNDRRLALWLRLLLIADQAHPASPHVPQGTNRPSLNALVTCGLVSLGTGNRYRITGLDKERARRWGARGGTDEPPTPDPNGTPKGPKRDPSAPSRAGDTRDETRKDKTRKEETSTAREDQPVTAEETDLFAFLAQRGAFIRPESGFGVRLLGLVDRRGLEAVIEAVKSLDTGERMSDRQWVFGLERVLDEIPSPPMDELPQGPSHGDRIYERMMARRLEFYRSSGQWPEDWGPKPEEVSAA